IQRFVLFGASFFRVTIISWRFKNFTELKIFSKCMVNVSVCFTGTLKSIKILLLTSGENTKAIKRLWRESAVKKTVNKPQEISFKTVDDFLAFENVDEETYNDLVGYFIYLGRSNPTDCAAEYFRSIFPEDEEVSPYLTLNGRITVPGGCKLRDSRFAQACQDAINANKHFPNPNKVDFYDALEKALKSLKTRKWRYNKRKRQAPHEEREAENTNDLDEEIRNTNGAEDIEDTQEAEYIETQDNVDDDQTLEEMDDKNSQLEQQLREDWSEDGE
ncbi:hypothetical protein DMN91_009786, partial [Ooceraea biroi]